MRWIKLHVEARTDAKLRTLTDAQHRVWFNLLCLAGEVGRGGEIPEMPEAILAAEVANGDMKLLEETIERLEVLRGVTGCYRVLQGVTRGVTLTFLAFGKRQYIKPGNTPARVRERVAKHRRNKTSGVKNEDTNSCNTHVTPCNTPPRARASDSDSDSELTPPTPPSPAEGGGGLDSEGGNGYPIVGLAEAVEAARDCFPGTRLAEDIAESVPPLAQDLKGRFDCLASAIRAADKARKRKPIDNLYAYVLTTAKRLVRENRKGEPIAVEAEPPAATEPDPGYFQPLKLPERRVKRDDTDTNHRGPA